ncbi:NVEALA domain-containing protein [Macellibacteroides fermentans]|jgi:hypothetical protein|uniref:NVEALA domain-containing protein n=1 Tax=Macellibacteroides fermentans TaxID=879969 RepID=UPI003B965D08
MKKKIFGAALIAAMAITAGWNFNQSKNEVELSDLALANVEALANDESGGSTFYCCGNTSTCAKGKDQNGNEFIIHGRLSTNPC